jgi:cytoskeleton protein RodZ
MSERRGQGLSLGDIARQLKLSVRQVEALEHDDYSAFPGPVFVRGFLRNYAKLLRLDADALVAMAHLPSIAEPAVAQEAGADGEQEPGARSARSGILVGIVVLAVLLGLALTLRGGRDRGADRIPAMAPPGAPGTAVSSQHPDSPPPGTTAPSRATGPSEGAPALGVPPATPSSTPPAGGTLATSEVAPPVPAVPVTPAAVGDAGSRETPAPAQSVPSKSELRLAFENESWVEVKDKDGTIIFSRTNLPGSQRTVRGVPPFTLVIGNAHAVKLSYRGKTVDLGPHTRVDVARLVLE